MAEKKTKKAKVKVNVKVLNRDRIMQAETIRVVVKGGKTFTFRISRPILNNKKLILYNEHGVPLILTSVNKLAVDVEMLFRNRGMEPLYIYPSTQHTLFE
jgi:isopentenyl phosphate kinase